MAQSTASATAGPTVTAATTSAANAARDRLALRRLAEQHGASGLYRMMLAGGASRQLALAALAEVDDAHLIVGALAQQAVEGPPAERRATLDVILRIASRPPSQTEPLDPDSLGQCFQRLDALSRDRTVAVAERALAVSALRAFSRAGYYDERRVLTELDPPVEQNP